MMRLIEQVPFIWILGTRVHMVQIPQVIELMGHWIEKERQKCHYIVASGMHAVMESNRDETFKAIINSADLFVPDGFGLVWLARRRGFSLKRRVSGAELIQEFCKIAAQNGYKIFFYGDTEDVLQLLQTKLQRQFPDLKIVGAYSPPFRPLTPEEDTGVIRMINEAQPDVLWVGLGLPKQERWMFEHRDLLKVPVMVGVGAAFKFLSGKVRRAPPWLGEHGLEWVWRFLHEPRKLWRRALIDVPQFVCYTLLELISLKKGRQ